jgi:hypothetical protein
MGGPTPRSVRSQRTLASAQARRYSFGEITQIKPRISLRSFFILDGSGMQLPGVWNLWSCTLTIGQSRILRPASALINRTVVTLLSFSTIAMSRNKPALLPYAIELRALDLTREADNTAALHSVVRENTRLLQIAAFEEHIEEDECLFVAADRAAIRSLCDMEPTELQIYTKMVDVYNKAKSHFLFDIVEVQVKHFLNAERLKAEAEQPPRCLS